MQDVGYDKERENDETSKRKTKKAQKSKIEWDIAKHIENLERDERENGQNAPEDKAPAGATVENASGDAPVHEGIANHLKNLRWKQEQEEYDRMVADITRHEREAKAAAEGGLVTYRQQLSFGLHVLVMMGSFYAFGHVAGTALTSDRAMQAFVGLVMMVFALLMETMLFVIRTSVPPSLSPQQMSTKRSGGKTKLNNNSEEGTSSAKDGNRKDKGRKLFGKLWPGKEVKEKML